jgi:hypothetical protein
MDGSAFSELFASIEELALCSVNQGYQQKIIFSDILAAAFSDCAFIATLAIADRFYF